MLNFELTPEQLDLQKKARDFALKEILPVAWYSSILIRNPQL